MNETFAQLNNEIISLYFNVINTQRNVINYNNYNDESILVNYEFKNFKYNVIEDSQLNLDANMICGFDKIDPYKTNFNNSYFKCLDISAIYSVDVIDYLILQVG